MFETGDWGYVDSSKALVEGAHKDEIVFWTWNRHRDTLHHRSMADALEDWIGSFDNSLYPAPRLVTLYGFRRRKVSPLEVPDFEEVALESLEDEHGDPYTEREPGECWRNREEVQKASEKLTAVMIRNYRPWACEMVVEVVADAKAFSLLHWKPEEVPRVQWSGEDGGAREE